MKFDDDGEPEFYSKEAIIEMTKIIDLIVESMELNQIPMTQGLEAMTHIIYRAIMSASDKETYVNYLKECALRFTGQKFAD